MSRYILYMYMSRYMYMSNKLQKVLDMLLLLGPARVSGAGVTGTICLGPNFVERDLQRTRLLQLLFNLFVKCNWVVTTVHHYYLDYYNNYEMYETLCT